MKYAVVQSGGKQYIARVGEVLTVDKLEGKEGAKFNFESVLLVKEEDKLSIGTPFVAGAVVSGTLVKQYQGKKLDVMRFKAKVRERRKIGFRPQLTDVKIEKIELGQKNTKSKKA